MADDTTDYTAVTSVDEDALAKKIEAVRAVGERAVNRSDAVEEIAGLLNTIRKVVDPDNPGDDQTPPTYINPPDPALGGKTMTDARRLDIYKDCMTAAQKVIKDDAKIEAALSG